MKHINKKRFWDNKILGWEKDKYSVPKSTLGKLLDVNRSLKKRQQIAQSVLMQVVKGRTVLEIGCGTARLLPFVFKAGATKYIGVDISEEALKQAQAKAKELDLEEVTQFYQLDVNVLNKIDVDICFSLGLLDWLALAEIEQMLSCISCRYYFHSFSERRVSFQQILHRLYVYMLYGHRTKSYVPRYYTQKQIVDIFTSYYKFPAKYFRSNTGFISFVYHLERVKGFEFSTSNHEEC